ncbi:MAG: histidine phosphatase family protein [Acidobacteriota bacterium]|nr:histidine phosphatase family protein [Acidobacteriota bacterium]
MSRHLYLMRHAETLFNLQRKTQGWCDSPLTPRGVEQARLTGQELARRGLAFDHAYCSTAERCSDTLELVTEAAFGQAMPYERRKGLRELNFGSYEAQDQFLESHDDDFDTFYVPFGGESHADAVARFEADLLEIIGRPGHESVLVCSHGGIAINFYMRWREHAQVPFSTLSNCATYDYEYRDGIFSCVGVLAADLSSLEEPGMPTQARRIGAARDPR